MKVTILILVDGFLQSVKSEEISNNTDVTILILVDGFLQYKYNNNLIGLTYVTILILVDGFLQYNHSKSRKPRLKSHNPYFSRWFSAMQTPTTRPRLYVIVTILILVDGFLQY